MKRNKIIFIFGIRRYLLRVILLIRMTKYLLNKKSFPLFYLSKIKNGVFKTYEKSAKLGFKKMMKLNNSNYFSLTIPHYPSKAYDNAIANGMLNLMAAGTENKRQIDNVILGISSLCKYKCKHCYEKEKLSNIEIIPTGVWKNAIRDLQEIGTSIIILSGGEPMMRYDELLEILRSGNKDKSDFHINTSGYGVTKERAVEMKASGLTAAGIGLDDVDEQRFDNLRNFKGAYKNAVNAVECFNYAGIFTYLNLCVTKELILSNQIWKYYDMAKELNVGIIQILEPRPVGGYFTRNSMDLFSPKDRQYLIDFVTKANNDKRYRNYPLLYYIAQYESPENLGCGMGGLSHLTIDCSGNVNPCVFVPISFGNILDENFQDIYGRLRAAIPNALHKECPSLLLAETIKNRVEKGFKIPIPIKEVSKEWKEMYN